jgi:plastocyanin
MDAMHFIFDTIHATRTRALAGALVIALAAAACNGAATNGPPQPGAGNAVTIADFSFAPAALTVSVGTSVTWTNNGPTGHTVTANDGSFDSDTAGNNTPIDAGKTFSHTFATAGTFAYHCKIHSSMTGTVTVTG